MISIMSVPICNHFYAREANSGKVTSFEGVPPFLFFVRGTPSPNAIKFCHKILETLDYRMVKTRFLYLTWALINTGT